MHQRVGRTDDEIWASPCPAPRSTIGDKTGRVFVKAAYLGCVPFGVFVDENFCNALRRPCLAVHYQLSSAGAMSLKQEKVRMFNHVKKLDGAGR